MAVTVCQASRVSRINPDRASVGLRVHHRTARSAADTLALSTPASSPRTLDSVAGPYALSVDEAKVFHLACAKSNAATERLPGGEATFAASRTQVVPAPTPAPLQRRQPQEDNSVSVAIRVNVSPIKPGR